MRATDILIRKPSLTFLSPFSFLLFLPHATTCLPSFLVYTFPFVLLEESQFALRRPPCPVRSPCAVRSLPAALSACRAPSASCPLPCPLAACRPLAARRPPFRSLHSPAFLGPRPCPCLARGARRSLASRSLSRSRSTSRYREPSRPCPLQ